LTGEEHKEDDFEDANEKEEEDYKGGSDKYTQNVWIV